MARDGDGRWQGEKGGLGEKGEGRGGWEGEGKGEGKRSLAGVTKGKEGVRGEGERGGFYQGQVSWTGGWGKVK